MTPEQLKRFDEASNHPYECDCTICTEWWDLMGPEDEDLPEPPCPTCKGDGTVNPLTAPQGHFSVGTEQCPTCEGSGEGP